MKEKIDYSRQEIQLPYDTMLFEMTRRCNLKCQHCFRGNAENIDMSKEIIDRVIPQISSVMHINLTGGEPFLAPDMIDYLADKLIENKVKFTSFGVVTNGTILGENGIKAVQSINKIAAYIYEYLKPLASKTMSGTEYIFDKEEADSLLVGITVSDDEYHSNNAQKAVDFYKKYANKYVKVGLQSEWERTDEETGEKFTMKDQHTNLVSSHGSWLDKEGRAAENNLGYKVNSTDDCANICHTIHLDEKGRVMCNINISANGNMSLGTQLSYENLDKFSMGNVLERPMSCMINDWNWKEPLQCIEVHRLMECYTGLNDINISEDRKEYLQLLRYCLEKKREGLKLIHREFPYLTIAEATLAFDADANLETDGDFAMIMSIAFPEYRKKYEGWEYDQKVEQKIFDEWIVENNFRSVAAGDFSVFKKSINRFLNRLRSVES